MPSTLIAFTVALVASLLLTAQVRQLALHLGVVDLPGPRKLHLQPVPLLGGLAIYGGVVLALLIAIQGRMFRQTIGIIAGATFLAIVGFVDDSGWLHHQIKLFVGMPVAALILLATGIRAQVFSVLVPGTWGIILDIFLTIFWVVGITAAFSILDYMDGLCAGVAAIAAAYFAAFAWLEGQVIVRILGAAAFGAAVGFLRWNFNPAKIFMGDGGAMFLGFLMATLGLKLRLEGAPASTAWMIPVLVLAAPIFDTLLVSISRARRGLLPFTSPGKDHTAHRLSNLGLGRRGAVVTMYAIGLLGGMLAWFVYFMPVKYAYWLVGAVAVAALLTVLALESAPYERQEKAAKP